MRIVSLFSHKMYNKDEMLEGLEEFKRKSADKIPPVLEAYLRKVANTGETMFPWYKVRPLMVHKLDQVMTDFYSQAPLDSSPPAAANAHTPAFTAMRQRILQTMGDFTGAPFTIQRLCELMTEPGKHYRRTDKFLRGIEKNLLVVSAVDPQGVKIVSEPLVNGTDSNGFESVQHTPEKPKLPFLPPPAPANSPATSCFNSASNSQSSQYISPLANMLAVSSTEDSSGPPGKRQKLSEPDTESTSDAAENMHEGVSDDDRSTGAADSSDNVSSDSVPKIEEEKADLKAETAGSAATDDSTTNEAESVETATDNSEVPAPVQSETASEASTSGSPEIDEERRDSNDSQGFDTIVESMDTHSECDVAKVSESSISSVENVNTGTEGSNSQDASEVTCTPSVASTHSVDSDISDGSAQDNKSAGDRPDSTDHSNNITPDDTADDGASEAQASESTEDQSECVVNTDKTTSPETVSQTSDHECSHKSPVEMSTGGVDSSEDSCSTSCAESDSNTTGCDSSSQSVTDKCSTSDASSSTPQQQTSDSTMDSSCDSNNQQPMETD